MIVKGFAAGEAVSAYLTVRAEPWINERRPPPSAPFAAVVADAAGTATLPTLAAGIEYVLWGTSGRFVHVLDSTTRPPKGTPV